MEKTPDASERILDAAERLFASHGFSGTTIKMIAAESKQNSALIYYYHDSKETLYRHILERLVAKISGEASQRAVSSTGPEGVIRAVVESQIAVLAAKPHLPVLLARELIDWKAAHAEPAIRSLSAGLFERLRMAIENGQQAGIFNAQLNPRFAAISVVAQVGYLVLASPVAGILLGRGPAGPSDDDVRAFGAHAAEFALMALRSGAVASGEHAIHALTPESTT
jgi:AcrR family transcriptional regulator